jgi:hypothetical protein
VTKQPQSRNESETPQSRPGLFGDMAEGMLAVGEVRQRIRDLAGEIGRDTTVRSWVDSGSSSEIGLFLGSLQRHVAGTSIAYLGATRASEVSE